MERVSEKIKVVIVDDVVQTRTDIKRLLYFEEDMEVVGEAGDGREAMEVVEKTSPDVVLMDINMPVLDGIAATEALTVAHPRVSVIIISIQGEQEYLKKAMAAGAREYLVKPLSSEEMASTIRQVYQLSRRRNELLGWQSSGADEGKASSPESKFQLISIFSGKGGSGKTTIASNLALALARKKLKVALVDLDLQFGDVSVFFNLNETRSISDLVQEEKNIQEVLDNYLIHHVSGVYILPAPLWPQESEKVKAEHVESIIGALRENFDHIILDTSSSFSDINLLALEQSDLILLPVRREIASIKNAKAALDILKTLNLEEKTRVILNQAGLDLGIDLEDLERGLDCRLAHIVANDEKTIVSSINRGVPFVLESPGTEVARDLIALGEKILAGFENKKVPARNKPLVKLFSF